MIGRDEDRSARLCSCVFPSGSPYLQAFEFRIDTRHINSHEQSRALLEMAA